MTSETIDIGEKRAGTLAHFARSCLLMARSEVRVTIFVWALITSYLIASNLRPATFTMVLLVSSGYLLSLGVYIANALGDLEEDRINSPSRPLPSGAVGSHEAILFSILLLSSSLSIASFISLPTLALYTVCIFLGIAYSTPRIQAKRVFQFKIIIPVAGSAIFSLAGGSAAQSMNPVIFFAAIAFALFALVTLLLGDIADVRGDRLAGVRSLPIVIGAKNSVKFVTIIPAILCILGILAYQFVNMNVLFLILIIAISAYSSLSVGALLGSYGDRKSLRRVKSRMRVVHFILQIAFIVGVIAF